MVSLRRRIRFIRVTGDRWEVHFRRFYSLAHLTMDWPSHGRFVDEATRWYDILPTRTQQELSCMTHRGSVGHDRWERVGEIHPGRNEHSPGRPRSMRTVKSATQSPASAESPAITIPSGRTALWGAFCGGLVEYTSEIFLVSVARMTYKIYATLTCHGDNTMPRISIR